jgi:uncharacterized protein (DUF2147 family)
MRAVIIAVVLMAASAARAQESGVLGRWATPDGAAIEIYRCDALVCAKLIALSPDAPVTVDVKNPDAKLRTRPLCGLQMGSGFHLTDANHAEDGQLYDPKSGKTYSGSMAMDGARLKLRGYIGIKMFGRTEMWTRVRGSVPACAR